MLESPCTALMVKCWKVRGYTFGHHVESSKTDKHIGLCPQALMSHFGKLMHYKNPDYAIQIPKLSKHA